MRCFRGIGRRRCRRPVVGLAAAAGYVWWTALALAALGAAAAAQGDSTYRDHLNAAQAAEATHDETAAHTHFLRALALIHGHSDVLYMLARNELRLGQPSAAVARLRTIAAMGIAYPADHDTAFKTLWTQPEFTDALRAMARDTTPIGHAGVVYTLPDRDFLAEDLAYDPGTHTFYVSSVHRRKILAIPEHGPMREFATAARDTLDAVFAVLVDATRRVLWATTGTAAQAEDYHAGTPSRSAVLRYDLRSGRLVKRYPLPVDGLEHEPGDMTIDASGSAIVSDGLSGIVYAIPASTDSLVVLVGRGTFRSPQTPAVTPDGRILVADYALGVASIDPATHAVTWIAHADTVAMNGIDGMYLAGRTLWAMQNGTQPVRVTRFELDPSLQRVASWTVIERATPHLGQPTHGSLVDGYLYFIGNSGWERFGDDGTITPDSTASAPVILRTPAH